ncbi:hypothetical protein Vadar_015828 [Vaccinium darrowii]|uniref:Uncharacterized protein n=1 Tax=Vaccinium darrowii TaxID=229202 RepID=A0ACB7YP51_9ERIC|nr:hypothetical protein Vadar_015828 [Vaccinium darrowii]
MKHTSATKNVSSSFKQQTVLKACTRSLQFPYFGTVTVTGNGKAVPSVLKTVSVIVRVVVEGSGNERYMNGSNVTDNFLQNGQTNVDRY